jgi:hypothetical protein
LDVGAWNFISLVRDLAHSDDWFSSQ